MKKIITLLLCFLLSSTLFAKKSDGLWRPKFAPTSTSIPAVERQNRANELEKRRLATTLVEGSEKDDSTPSENGESEISEATSDKKADKKVLDKSLLMPPPDLTDDLIARAHIFDATDYKGKMKRSIRIVNMTRNHEGKVFYLYFYFGQTDEDWEYYGTATLDKYYTNPRIESPYNKNIFELRYFALISKEDFPYKFDIKKKKKDLVIYIYDKDGKESTLLENDEKVEPPIDSTIVTIDDSKKANKETSKNDFDPFALTDKEKKSAVIIDNYFLDGKFSKRIAFRNKQDIDPLSFWVYGINYNEPLPPATTQTTPVTNSDDGVVAATDTKKDPDPSKDNPLIGDFPSSTGVVTENKAAILSEQGDWQIIGAIKLNENGSSDVVNTPLKKPSKFAYYAFIERDGKSGFVLSAHKAFGDLVIEILDPNAQSKAQSEKDKDPSEGEKD